MAAEGAEGNFSCSIERENDSLIVLIGVQTLQDKDVNPET